MTAGSFTRAWRWHEPTDAEYHRFVAFVHDASGISLNDSKRALVARRLMRASHFLKDIVTFERLNLNDARTA